MLNQEIFSSEGDDINPEMIVQDLKSPDLGTQMRAVSAARSILCLEDPPINRMVQAGIIEPLVKALDRDDCPDLQYGALGVLSNVAFWSREHTMAVVQSGAIPKLINFLAYEDALAARAIVFLGNVALHGREARDAVLSHGAVHAMLPYMRKNTPVRRLRTFVRTYSSLCSHDNTMATFDFLSPAMPYLNELLDIQIEKPEENKDKQSLMTKDNENCFEIQETLPEHEEKALVFQNGKYLDINDEESLDIEDRESLDTEDGPSEEEEVETEQQPTQNVHIVFDVLVAACTALTNIMHGPDECIEGVQAAGRLTARLVQLLGHDATDVREAALNALGNMLAGGDAEVNRCLDVGCLEHIVSLLQSSERCLVREAARAASNILAGTHLQIQRALDQDILTPLRNILADGDPECCKQSASAIINLCYNGSAVQRAQLVSSGVLRSYCALLAGPDAVLAVHVLDSLHELMQAAVRDGDVKHVCYMLDECDLLDVMQQLHEHITDEDHCCKMSKMKKALRTHAREERSIMQDGEFFTAAKIVQELKSEDLARQSRAARAAGRMLRERTPPLNALVEAGVVVPLLQTFDTRTDTKLLHVAAWALSKITAGRNKHRMAAVEGGAIPKLLALLSHGGAISELAACSLGNLALHGSEMKEALLAYIRSDTDTAFTELRTFLRTYKNLCRQVSHVQMKFRRVSPALPFISELLHIEDQTILKDACWAIVNLTHCSDEGIEGVQAVSGLTGRLVQLLGHDATDVKEAALNALGNMLSGTLTQTERCLDAGCLDHISHLLRCSNPSLLKKAIWTLSAILRGTYSQIQRALDKDILTPLLSMLRDGKPISQKPAAYAVTCIFCRGSAAQRSQLVSKGMLQPYCALLVTHDRTLAQCVLYGLHALLRVAVKGRQLKPLCRKLNTIGILDHIQRWEDRDIDTELRLKALELSANVRRLARGEHIFYVNGKVFTPKEIVEDLKSQDLAIKKRAVCASFNLRSLKTSARVLRTVLVQNGILAEFVNVLDKKDCAHFHLAVSCLFTWLTDTTYVPLLTGGSLLKNIREKNTRIKALIQSGVISKLVTLLAHGNRGVVTHAVMALSNICQYGVTIRHMVLAQNPLPAILPHLSPDTPVEQLKTLLSSYRRLCHAPGTICPEFVLPALPYLYQLLYVEDQHVLKTACETINDIMFCQSNCKKTSVAMIDKVQAVDGLTARMMTLMWHESAKVQIPALYVVSNMLSGDENQIDRCLDLNCVDALVYLLKSSDPSLVWKAADAMARVCRGTQSQIQRALDKHILTPLQNIIAHGHPECKKASVRAITNICLFGSTEQQEILVRSGVLHPYSAALALPDQTVDKPPTDELVLLGLNTLIQVFDYTPVKLSDLIIKGENVFNFANIAEDLKSQNLATRRRATGVVHCILHEQESPISAMVEAGVVSPLVQLIDNRDCSEDNDVICALEKITSGTHKDAMAVVRDGAICKLVRVISCGGHLLKAALAAKVVGNLALLGPQISDLVVAEGAVRVMLPYMRRSTPLKSLRSYVITYTSLYRHYDKSTVKQDYVSPALPYICELLDIEDDDIQSYCCIIAAIMYDSDACRAAIQEAGSLADAGCRGVMTRVTALLGHEAGGVKLMALKAVSRMLYHADTQQIDHILGANFLNYIVSFLSDSDTETQGVASCAIAFFCMNGSVTHLDQLVSSGVLTPYCALLAAHDRSVAVRVLEGLDAILEKGASNSKVKTFCKTLKEIGVLDQIQELQQHDIKMALRRKAIVTSKMIQDEKVFTLTEIIQELGCEDLARKTSAVRAAHRFICRPDPPIAFALQAGIIAPLVAALDDKCPVLLHEVLVLLADIVTETPEAFIAITDNGAIPKLIALLRAFDGVEVAIGAVRMLGYIAQAGLAYRDLVLADGAAEAVLPLLSSDTPLQLLKICLYSYFNFCNNLSWIEREPVSPALPRLTHLLDSGDYEVLECVCKILACLMYNPPESIMDNQCVGPAWYSGEDVSAAMPVLAARLVNVLGHENIDVKTSAILALVNMLTHPNKVDHCLDAGCLDHIVAFLQCSDSTLVKKAVLATRNLLFHSHSVTRILVKDILTALRKILANVDTESQNDIACTVTNLCISGSAAQRAQVVSSGILEPFCALLAISDAALTEQVLGGLGALLQNAVDDGELKPLCLTLIESGVLRQIQQYDRHETDKRLRRKAAKLSDLIEDESAEPLTLEEIVRELKSQDPPRQTRAVRATWQLFKEQYFSHNRMGLHSFMAAIVQAGIVAPLVQFLNTDDSSEIQYKAMMLLSAIPTAAPEHLMALVQGGAIPKVIACLSCEEHVVTTAICILGHIASHGADNTDLLLSHGALAAMLPHMRPDAPLKLLNLSIEFYRTLTMCDATEPSHRFKRLSPALPQIYELLNNGDEKVLETVCWALAGLIKTDEDIEAIQAVSGLTGRLVTLLEHGNTKVTDAVIIGVMLMLSGTDKQVDRCLDVDCIDRITTYLQRKGPSLMMEVTEATLDNVHAGPQIKCALDTLYQTYLLYMFYQDN